MYQKNKIKLNFDDAKKLIYENSNNFSSNKKLEDFIKSYNYQKIIPKIIINYQRLAFLTKDKSTRLTFDFNLNCESNSLDFFNLNNIKYPLLEGPNIILEIKFKNTIPKFLGDIICSFNLNRSAISKYYLAFKYQNFINKSDTIFESF